MALFEYLIDDSSIGAVLDPPNGFLSSLRRTQAGIREEPQFSASLQRWTSGYFVLRASGKSQNLIVGPSDGIPSMIWAAGASYGYHGALKVVAVPRGSEWQLTLSDQPVAHRIDGGGNNFNNSNFKPINPPAQPKVEAA